VRQYIAKSETLLKLRKLRNSENSDREFGPSGGLDEAIVAPRAFEL
jgi:hypothetical protein